MHRGHAHCIPHCRGSRGGLGRALRMSSLLCSSGLCRSVGRGWPRWDPFVLRGTVMTVTAFALRPTRYPSLQRAILAEDLCCILYATPKCRTWWERPVLSSTHSHKHQLAEAWLGT